jgi:hypothetical protein
MRVRSRQRKLPLPQPTSQFTYLDGPLSLSSISPQAAPAGAVVTLTGAAFVPEPSCRRLRSSARQRVRRLAAPWSR